MDQHIIVLGVQLTNAPGAVKAHVDIRVVALVIRGFSVIEKDGKPPWVGFPQKPGKIPGKYFPVVEAEGELHKQICKAIIDAYIAAKNAADAETAED